MKKPNLHIFCTMGSTPEPGLALERMPRVVQNAMNCVAGGKEAKLDRQAQAGPPHRVLESLLRVGIEPVVVLVQLADRIDNRVRQIGVERR